MKILHIVGDSSYGGAAKAIIRNSQLWAAEGGSARILATNPEFQQAARDAGIGCLDINCIWRKIEPLKDIVGLYRLWRYLRSERFTIVHTHTTKAGFVGRIAAKLAGVPNIVHTIHGFAFHERSSEVKIIFYATLEKLAARCCHRIVTVSNFHRHWALDLQIAGTEKLTAIPNGVPDMLECSGASRSETRASLGMRADDVMVFTPGRLAAEKGLERLVEAIAATPRETSQHLRIIIAGDGPLRPALEQHVRRVGLHDQVRFLGFRTDIAALLMAADIVVLPSEREGLSIALLEAMSAGCAIVATGIGSNLEAVGRTEKNDFAAVIVQTNDVQAISDAILHLADDVQRREELGMRARLRWKNEYTLDRVEDAYRGMYQDLLHQKTTSTRGSVISETIRRLVDIVGSASLILLFLPLLLVCAAVIKLSSPGPILFTQSRLGIRAGVFKLFKFRTMVIGAGDIRNADGSTFSGTNDPRVTKVGHFLRSISLDELPQLLNILRGEMSFVGPRPDLADQLQFYKPQEKRKLDVKPGLTGLAQISGRNSISWQRRKELDVIYVEQRSLWLDLTIFCKTVPYVLRRKDLYASPESLSDS